MTDIQTSHTQMMLANSHKQQFDTYAVYTGIRIKKLLEELGIDTKGAEGITIFAPDGYKKSFSMDDVNKKYPRGKYYLNLDDKGLGEGKGFVHYPDSIPYDALNDEDEIPVDPYIMLAYQRDFEDMAPAYLDKTDWKIHGEGPFRFIRPQSSPGVPDRGANQEKADKYDYDDLADHNAGDMVRGVIVVRIDPMPDEYEEFDASTEGWRYLDEAKLVIYGHGVPKE